MSQYKISIGSHIGKIRENNEDNFFCNGLYKNDITKTILFYDMEMSSEFLNVFGIFDGMGGIDYGEKASYISVKILDGYLENLKKYNKEFDGEFVLKKINSVICKVKHELQKNIGSTAVILGMKNNTAKLYNIGDSRGYFFHAGQLRQITIDHTEENSMRRIQRELGIRCNISNSAKHMLTQHLGIEEEEFLLDPAISDNIIVNNKDIFLLCSDGLTDMLSDKEIDQILNQNSEIIDKRNCLIESALKSGGKDNITVILVEVLE